MQIILDGNYRADRSVVALGMFDGVHIGHRVLLQRGAALARRHGVPLVVCTFQEHPLHLIAPEKCPPLLTTFEERAALMEALGVDVLYAMPFSTDIMHMPPEDYVGHLVRRFHPTDVVCGYNHTFGCKGQGTPALLEVLGGALGFATSVVPNITLAGREVSSSAIRRLLSDARVKEAAELLGRPYSFHASICASQHGGVYYAQISESGKAMPPLGDYRILISTESRRYPAVLRMISRQQAVVSLPAQAGLDGEVDFHFLRNLSLPF